MPREEWTCDDTRTKRTASTLAGMPTGECLRSPNKRGALPRLQSGAVKVLALCKYGRMGASSRLRTMQYFDPLRSEGIHLDVDCLLGDDYLKAKYGGHATGSIAVRAYLSRLLRLRNARSYDLIHLEKEAFPWWPWLFERGVLPDDVPLSVDLDDAIFHLYDSHRFSAVRTILGSKIDLIMRRSDLVTTGSRYIQQRAAAAGASRIEYLPTVVDASRYAVEPRNQGERVTIGWIGSPSTSKYLGAVAKPLTDLSNRYDLACVAVGADPSQLRGTPFRSIEWSEYLETQVVSTFDIGIMPLEDSRWELGKCAYKIIQYMAAGVPVVASPVGMNVEVIERAQCGAFASSDEEWSRELEKLINDPPLRAVRGEYGRAAVESFYSIQAQAPRLAAMWRDVVRARGSRRG